MLRFWVALLFVTGFLFLSISFAYLPLSRFLSFLGLNLSIVLAFLPDIHVSTHFRASYLCVTTVSGSSEIPSDFVPFDPVLISTEKHEVQSISELANLFSGELDFLGVSCGERPP